MNQLFARQPRCGYLLAGLLLSALLNTGCTSLSKIQREEISRWSTACEEFSGYPSRVLQAMADLRRERGAFYTASLSDPALRLRELEDLHSGWMADHRLAKRLDVAAEAMQTYARALDALSHPNRYEELGVRTRSLGRRLDSLVVRYNEINPESSLPVGYGTAAGRTAGFGGNLWIRHRQYRLLKPLITRSDTLIGTLSDGIISLMKDDMMLEFLNNEEEGMKQNYLSFLQHHPATPQQDQQYLSLREKLETIKDIRQRAVSSARSLRNAHARLKEVLYKDAGLSDYIADMEWAEKELNKIGNSIRKIDDTDEEE